MKTVTYNDSDIARRTILKLTGKEVDTEGYIVESGTGNRVISPSGEEVLFSDFAGIRKGSEIIITKDLPSLLEQSDYIDD